MGIGLALPGQRTASEQETQDFLPTLTRMRATANHGGCTDVQHGCMCVPYMSRGGGGRDNRTSKEGRQHRRRHVALQAHGEETRKKKTRARVILLEVRPHVESVGHDVVAEVDQALVLDEEQHEADQPEDHELLDRLHQTYQNQGEGHGEGQQGMALETETEKGKRTGKKQDEGPPNKKHRPQNREPARKHERAGRERRRARRFKEDSCIFAPPHRASKQGQSRPQKS